MQAQKQAKNYLFEDADETIGDRVYRVRLQADYTQTELGKLILGCQNIISRIEVGSRDPRASEIVAIAKTCNCTAEYLLYGSRINAGRR